MSESFSLHVRWASSNANSISSICSHHDKKGISSLYEAPPSRGQDFSPIQANPQYKLPKKLDVIPALTSSRILGAHSKSNGPFAHTKTGINNHMPSNRQALEQEHMRIRSKCAPPTIPGQMTGSHTRLVL